MMMDYSDRQILQLLTLIYKHLKKDNDFVLLVSGDEGVGKSRLVLRLIHLWYDHFFDGCTEQHAKKLTSSVVNWVRIIKECERYGINAFDEGGKINSRRAMGKLNKIIQETYQIIRGMNFFSIIVIPSVFDLETSFPKRRAKGLIDISSRGVFNYYGKEKLRSMIDLNQNRMIKRTNVVRPDMCRVFYSNYTGIMLKEYLKNKEENMREQLDRLEKEVNDFEGRNPDIEQAIQMKKDGYMNKEIAKELNWSDSKVSRMFAKLHI